MSCALRLVALMSLIVVATLALTGSAYAGSSPVISSLTVVPDRDSKTVLLVAIVDEGAWRHNEHAWGKFGNEKVLKLTKDKASPDWAARFTARFDAHRYRANQLVKFDAKFCGTPFPIYKKGGRCSKAFGALQLSSRW